MFFFIFSFFFFLGGAELVTHLGLLCATFRTSLSCSCSTRAFQGGLSTEDLRDETAALQEKLESNMQHLASLRARRDAMASHLKDGHELVADVQGSTDYGMLQSHRIN